jgi:hypothetical protein
VEDHLREQGLDPTPDPEWIAHFLEDLHKWRQVRRDAAVAETTLSEIHSHLQDLHQQLHTHLTHWNVTGPKDTHAASAQSLLERMETELDRRRRMESVQQQEQQLLQQEKDHEQDIYDICTRLELSHPDPAILRERVLLLPAWQQHFRDSETLRHRLSELRND